MSRSPLDFKNRKKSFSFSSRLSRLEKNFSVCLRPISLSPLDFQDFWDQFLFLLSIFKIYEKISLSPLDFQDFLNEHFDNWSLSMICQNMLILLYLTSFTFCPTGSWPDPDTASDKDCRKGKFSPLWFYVVCLTTSSVLNNFWWRKQPRVCFSLSTLEVKDKNFNILFLLSRLDLSAFLMSLSTLVNGYIHISILF